MRHFLQNIKRCPMERRLAWSVWLATIGSFLVQIILLVLQIRGK
jgi:hypothetical protein